jgi:hypothetical protein
VEANKKRTYDFLTSAMKSLRPLSPCGMETGDRILESLVTRNQQEEVLTAIPKIPALAAIPLMIMTNSGQP